MLDERSRRRPAPAIEVSVRPANAPVTLTPGQTAEESPTPTWEEVAVWLISELVEGSEYLIAELLELLPVHGDGIRGYRPSLTGETTTMIRALPEQIAAASYYAWALDQLAWIKLSEGTEDLELTAAIFGTVKYLSGILPLRPLPDRSGYEVLPEATSTIELSVDPDALMRCAHAVCELNELVRTRAWETSWTDDWSADN